MKSLNNRGWGEKDMMLLLWYYCCYTSCNLYIIKSI